MSQIIREQIYFQITTICAGMFMMFGYDILRLWRWMDPSRQAVGLDRRPVILESAWHTGLCAFLSDDRRRAALVRDSGDACRRYFV